MTKRKSKVFKTLAVVFLFTAFIAAVLFLAKDKPLSGLENTLGSGYTQEAETSPFSITYLDVGQGDCALVVCDGITMLIDAGDNGFEERVITYLHSKGIDRLDYAVCTHLHSDHIGGMPEVVEEFSPYAVIMPEVSPDLVPETYTYGMLLKSIEKSNSEILTPMPGETFEIGSAEALTLGPVTESTNHNDMSLVLKITYSGRTFLFTGDCEKNEEKDILTGGLDLNCDVLKVAHHGSSAASSYDFISAVSPAMCVISVGKDNDYGHPADSVIERLLRFTDKIYRTDLCGNIYLTCDGEKIYVTTQY